MQWGYYHGIHSPSGGWAAINQVTHAMRMLTKEEASLAAANSGPSIIPHSQPPPPSLVFCSVLFCSALSRIVPSDFATVPYFLSLSLSLSLSPIEAIGTNHAAAITRSCAVLLFCNQRGISKTQTGTQSRSSRTSNDAARCQHCRSQQPKVDAIKWNRTESTGLYHC